MQGLSISPVPIVGLRNNTFPLSCFLGHKKVNAERQYVDLPDYCEIARLMLHTIKLTNGQARNKRPSTQVVLTQYCDTRNAELNKRSNALSCSHKRLND